jgi:chlorophyll synthase
MTFTFSINNYFDADSDRKNPRRRNINAIASGKISKRNGAYLIILSAIIPLIVSFLFNFHAFLFCVFLVILGWIYSAPPVRLKGRLFFDIVWHFVGFVSYVIWGSFIAGSIGIINWLAAISIGAFSLIGQVENHIEDFEFDKESGTRTFAVWIGIKNAKRVLTTLAFIHLISLVPLIILCTISYYVTIILTIVLALLGFIFFKKKKEIDSAQTFFVKYSTYILGGSVYLSCLVYQILLLNGLTTLGLFESISFF